jgi:nicotinate-nucleotide adenylyltransferase
MELYFIVGQDAFHAITTWKDWEKLLQLCNFVVMTRPGYENKGLEGILPPEFASQFHYESQGNGFRGPVGYSIYFREVTFLDIASSRIRNRVRDGKSITYLTTEPVRHYIVNNGLYRNI